MILILASAHDSTARSLAETWVDASVLTPRDLSVAGWKHDPLCPENDVAVIGGARVLSRDVRGVVTRLPQVYPVELAHVASDDRPYVAAEMTAFLLSWLQSLHCRVMNPPTPSSLSGPIWRPERWEWVVSRAGIASARDADECKVATIVGKRCLGAGDWSFADTARRIAVAAGTNLIEISLARVHGAWAFVSANPFPNLLAPAIQRALRDALGAA